MKNARNESQPYLRLDVAGNIVKTNAAGAAMVEIVKDLSLHDMRTGDKPNQVVDMEIASIGQPVALIIVPIADGTIVLPLPSGHGRYAWMVYSATVSMDGWKRPLVDAMVAAIEQLGPEQQALLQSFDALQLIPNNMRIVASRLEPSGGPISVISENYKVSSMALSQRLQSFVGPGGSCAHAVEMMGRLRLLMGASAQLRLLVDQSVREPDWAAERPWLDLAIERLHTDIPVKIGKVQNATVALGASCAEVRRMMLGLDTIRILGRVESSRMCDAGGLSSAIDQLHSFHSEIQQRVERIMSLSEAVSLTAHYAATGTKRAG